MKKTFHTLLLALSICALGSLPQAACAQDRTVNNGEVSITFNPQQLDRPSEVERATRTVSTFTKLSTALGVQVRFTPSTGRQTQIKLTATKGYADYLLTQVDNGVLTVTWDSKRLRRDFKRKKFTLACLVEITAPVPAKVEASEGSFVSFTQALSLPAKFEVEAESGATVKASALNGDDVDVDVSSGSRFEATAMHLRSLDVDASSGSAVTIGGIVATAEVDLDASSGSTLHASLDRSPGSLKAEASSGARLHLSGSLEGQTYLEASSAGKLDASALRVPSAKVDASSGGKLSAPQVERLTFSESSGGKVSWTGHPQVTKKD